jgi:hypothetical protein
MTNKNITFCVNTEGFTEDQIIMLHNYCFKYATNVYEDVDTWIGDLRDGNKSLYKGIDYGNILTSYTKDKYFNGNVLELNEVQTFLGLTPPETPTAPLPQDFSSTTDDCMPVEENASHIVTEDSTTPYNFLYDIVKPSIKEFSLEVAITMSKDDLVYTIFHPLFDKEFKVVSEEEYEDLIKGFATLSKFYKPL